MADAATTLIDEIDERLGRLRALVAGDGRPRYTGCTWKRGTHSGAHVYDPLGTDLPPEGWPHPRPTHADIAKALEERGA